jgi:hypothetical protein
MLAPTVKTFAQDDDGLSEDEQALVDRALAAIEASEALTSVEVADDETLTMDLNINMAGQEFAMSQNKHKSTEGYLVRDGETESQSATFLVESSEEGPDGLSSYTLGGEMVFVDGVAYVNAAYEDSEGDVEELAEGWQMISSTEEIPAALSELDLDNLFDEEDDTLTKFAELTDHATAVELSEDELEDGTPIEVIEITLDKEGFAAFLASTADEEGDEAMMGLFTAEEAESGITLAIALDEEDNLVFVVVTLNYNVEELDAAALDASLEGATLSVNMEGSFIIGFASYNEEMEPIVAPELEAEAE